MEAVRIKSQIDIEESIYREESVHAKDLEKQLQVCEIISAVSSEVGPFKFSMY
jgi:hypothetical protein